MLAALFAVVYGGPVCNAAMQQVSASPGAVLLTVDAGKETSGEITIANSGDVNLSLQADVEPYWVDKEYNPVLVATPARSAQSWITIAADMPGVVPQGGIERLAYSVNVPVNARPGGYYAIMRTRSSPVTEKQGIAPSVSVGIIFYIRVNGTLTEAGSIMSAMPKLALRSIAVPLSYEMKNEGDSHFIGTIHYTIHTFAGARVREASIERVVLPGTARPVILNEVLPEPALGVGVYTVRGEASYLGKTEPLASNTVVVMAPRGVALIAAVILAVVIAIRYYTVRKAHK